MMRHDQTSARACLVGLIGLALLAGCGEDEQRSDVGAARDAQTQQAASPASQRTSPARRQAWETFAKEVGGRWQVHEHPARRVPQRVYGSGFEVPGSVDRPEVAAAFAEGFVARHAALLAPGATGADLVQVSNVLSDGVRSVGFHQLADGMRVLGGQVSLRFKRDRLIVLASEAFPDVRVTRPRRLVDSALARDRALAWIGRLTPGADALSAEPPEGPFVLPLDGKHHVVLRVKVASQAPLGRWDVFVDAADGAPVHHASTLMSETAQLSYRANVRNPGEGRGDFPASGARVTIDDADPTAADDAGQLSWDSAGEPVTVVASTVSDQVRIYTEVGDEASIAFEGVEDQAALVWDAEGDELTDAQVSAFVHLNRVKDYARGFAPDLGWLSAQAEALVNINDQCNAVSDGLNVYFFRSSQICENTALIADVVFHEFGHSLHNQSLIPGVGVFEGSLSEGISDYLSATITDDPAMARGFFKDSDDPLRHIDPDGSEQVWPDDVIPDDVHHNGRIISGALWDLRKLLIDQHGQDQGVALADRLYYESTRRASDIPTMFVEVLTSDDDDGDLANGTPNTCAIVEAFGAHGLASLDAVAPNLQTVPPAQDGFQIDLALNASVLACLGDAAPAPTLTWRLRDAPDTGGAIVMEDTGAGGVFSARIPAQPAGQVVQYAVAIEAFGATQRYPQNPADPRYEFYVGSVEPIYCTSFDDADAVAGWESGLERGEDIEGANDWQFGPAGGLSFDPPAAFSEPNVFGNDLSPDTQWNGAYQADRTNFGLSPAIDVSGYTNVRLQYMRWLSVEDARYDTATIYANNRQVWQNAAATGELHHIDREWRFHDVPLDEAIGGVGNVRVKFEINSDGGLEFGGWNIDDLCIVGVPSTCGNGELDGPNEACDDGPANSDTAPDACRADCQLPACGDGVTDSGESCDDGNTDDGDGCDAACAQETPCDGGFIPAGEVCDDGTNSGTTGINNGTTGTNNGTTGGTTGGTTSTSSNSGTSGDTAGQTGGGSGFVNNAGGSSDSGCSQVGHGDTLPLSALALVLGAFVLRRRRDG